jgi:hypothetical protein
VQAERSLAQACERVGLEPVDEVLLPAAVELRSKAAREQESAWDETTGQGPPADLGRLNSMWAAEAVPVGFPAEQYLPAGLCRSAFRSGCWASPALSLAPGQRAEAGSWWGEAGCSQRPPGEVHRPAEPYLEAADVAEPAEVLLRVLPGLRVLPWSAASGGSGPLGHC